MSLGDSIAGLHAAFGTVRPFILHLLTDLGVDLLKVLALLSRFRNDINGSSTSDLGRPGRIVDVSIVERSVLGETFDDQPGPNLHSMLNLMEGIIPEYSRKNKVGILSSLRNVGLLNDC